MSQTVTAANRNWQPPFSSGEKELKIPFMSNEGFRGICAFADIMSGNGVSETDISNHAKYRQVGKKRAEFRIGPDPIRPQAIVAVFAIWNLWDVRYLGMEVIILKGRNRRLYRYAREFPCEREIRDICAPFDCPNVKAIPELKDMISSFALDVRDGNHTRFVKVR